MNVALAQVWQQAIELADEAETERLAEDLAMCLRPRDVIALHGGLGAGKTTFARALLRALADDPNLEVPSPTFTLVQTYPGRVPVAHFDLFRLAGPDDLSEIGFDEALTDSAVLVEWPERAGSRLPGDRLDISLSGSGTRRRAVISGPPAWRDRLGRSLRIRAFLDEAGWPKGARRYLQGDASTRAYERVREVGREAVLMNAPAKTDIVPVKDGKPYSKVVHLAEDVLPFIAVDRALAAAGASVPTIYAEDQASGFLLLEDLGSLGVVNDGAPVAECYRVATELLAHLHNGPRPTELPINGGRYRLPTFESDILAFEARLLLDWYSGHVTGSRLPASAEAEFEAIWSDLFAHLASAERSWVLRDYHSPNLLWLPERSGIRRLGVIDFQDALYGPSAYDVASLLQDARITVPAELEDELFEQYCALRRVSSFDRDRFRQTYVILAAQRATRILGVFARLNLRDGKPGYLRHMPRLRGYLMRLFADPLLSTLALWYERHLPLQATGETE